MVVVLIVAAGAAWESRAVQLLAGHPSIVVLKRCVDVDDLLAAASAGQAGVAVLGLDAPGLDLTATEHLRRHGVRPVAVVPSGASPEAARLRASRIGLPVLVDESELDSLPGAVVAQPDEPVEPGGPGELDQPHAAEPVAGGRVIAVWGPGGAPGRTTLAAGLAAELARRRLRTVLVDADPYGGAVAQQLGVLDEVSGLLAAARLASSGELVERFATVQRGNRRPPVGDHRPAAAGPLDRGPRRRPRAHPRDGARARPGRGRHRLQPRGGPGLRLRLPARAEPDD